MGTMDYVLRNEEIFPEGGRRQLVVALWQGSKKCFKHDIRCFAAYCKAGKATA